MSHKHRHHRRGEYSSSRAFNILITIVIIAVAGVNISGILGIDYSYQSGDNEAEIYVDGELFVAPTRTFDYDFSQRHILIVSDDCTVEDEIEIVFSSKELADAFQGLIFSWE